MEAQLCTGEDIIVVGGGNSAGQAAVFLELVSKIGSASRQALTLEVV
jgi:thioredoxin reductase